MAPHGVPDYLEKAFEGTLDEGKCKNFAQFLSSFFGRLPKGDTKTLCFRLFTPKNEPINRETFKPDTMVLALSAQKTDAKKKALATKILLALILDEQANTPGSTLESAKMAAKTALQRIIDKRGLKLLNEQRFVVDAPAAVQGKGKPLPLLCLAACRRLY